MTDITTRDTYLRMSTHGTHGVIDVYSPRTFNRSAAQLEADAWVQREFGLDHYTDFDDVAYLQTGIMSFAIRRQKGKPMSLGNDRTRLKVKL
jgi:hypothetical protein